MADYTRPGRFDFSARGVDLNTPVDRLRESGYFYALKNVDVLTDGSIETRAGLTDRYASYVPIANKTPHHSFLRLNDSSSGSSAWTLVHGVGDTLAIERSSAVGTLVALDSGYSGKPLSISVYRPPRAVQPWAYVSDSSRMRKLRQDATTPSVHLVGLPAPTFEPIAWPSTGAFKTIDLFEPSGGGTGYTRWAAAGTGAIVGAVVGKRVNSAQAGVTPFETVTGADEIALVTLASMANIGVGTVLNIIEAGPGAEDVLVTQVNKGSATLTISSVIYDSGTTGLCSVVLSAAVREITTNSMLFNSTKTEYVRVRSVSPASDGTFSIRVSTTTTWAATNSVAAVASFVCHPLGSAPVAAGNATSEALNVTATAGTATFTQVIALDLSQLSWSSTPSPSSLDDFMHISMFIDHPELITEIKLLLDVDLLVNDFAHNYYFRALSPNDLTPVTHSSQTALDNRAEQITKRILDRAARVIDRAADGFGGGRRSIDDISRQGLKDPAGISLTGPSDGGVGTEPPRTQTTSGDSQWSEIIFPLNAMEKVGADDTRGFKNVAQIRIQIVCTGNVSISFDSWVIEGGFAPLIEPENGEFGYLYAYRARASSTGAVSDLSPLCRGESNARRQRVAVQLQQYTAASEVDYLDVFRIGGPLPVPCFVGSVANSATPVFFDIFDNTSVFNNRTAGGTFDPDDPDLQPWPDIDIPRSGTATSVSGTTVQSSAQFNTSWLPGTLITVDGVTTTIYRVISTSKLEVVDSLGTRTNVAWQVNEPVLGGQPFEILWGPFNDHLLAVGSRRNPGSLYFSKPKNPDATSRTRRLEITSNSDPLLNGFIFNGRAGVFSSRNLYYLDYVPSDPQIFSANVSPNDKGLYSRWAMAVGRRGVAWLASDGIYMMTGSGATPLTDAHLRPLFPYGGRPGVDTNGLAAPLMPNPVGAEEQYLRLFFDQNDNLRFVYRDSSAALHCLLYDFTRQGWRPFLYGKSITDFYSEEGAGVINLIAGSAETTAHVYTVGGAADNGTDAGVSIACQVTTYAYDANDPRAQKQWGDTDIDINPGGASVAITAKFDNLGTSVTPSASPLTGSSRAPAILDFSSGSGQFARNQALDITWTNAANQRPHFYLWEPSYIIHPEDTKLRATDYDFTESGLGYVRGLWVDADTAGVSRTIALNYINQLGVQVTYTITGVNHPVKSRIFYPISPTPFYASTLRIHPTDVSSWKQYSYHLVADPAPPFSTDLTAFTDGGDQRVKFLQGARVKIDTHGASVGLEVQGDAGVVLGTFTGLSSVLPTVVPLVLNPAVRTHLARIRPLNNVHLFEITWDWQSDAESVAYYEGQESSFDIPGFKHAREVYIAYASAPAVLTLTLVADGVAIAGIPTLPASSSYTRVRIVLPAKKWKAVKPYLTSTSPFLLYSRDSNILAKGWGDDGNGDYRSFELFGTMHRDRGIAVT